MRFMILLEADKNSEAGVLPDEKLLAEMGKYNEELVKAGVLLAAEGLHPSSKGARVKPARGVRAEDLSLPTRALDDTSADMLLENKSAVAITRS